MKIILPRVSPYTGKDQLKSNLANKFIGRGSPLSSTNAYRIAWKEWANTGNYNENDIVFISVEGNRSNRIKFDKEEVKKAIDAKVMFITDNKHHRSRPYNIGEREVAAFLLAHSYQEIKDGTWIIKNN